MQWVFWQMANLGPMAGQNHHFGLYAPEKLPYAIDRYVKETGRLYAVLNRRLADREFIAGDYSIADIASYPWVLPDRQSQNMDDFPHLKRWKEAIKARPATVRAYEKAKQINPARGRHPHGSGEENPVWPDQGRGEVADAACVESQMFRRPGAGRGPIGIRC